MSEVKERSRSSGFPNIEGRRMKYKRHRVNQLYFMYNTNFVYCFYYYIIIELVSLAATAQRGTIYATTRISMVDTIRIIATKYISLICLINYFVQMSTSTCYSISYWLNSCCIVYIYRYRCI